MSRKNHAPAFKARVALEALKGEQSLAKLVSQFRGAPHSDSPVETTMSCRGHYPRRWMPISVWKPCKIRAISDGLRM